MGILNSREFQNDDKLEQCAVRHSAHIFRGARGEHVKKIQEALIELNGAQIDANELAASLYGPSTARAVLNYKNSRSPPILGPGQKTADDIVGIQTIRHLDGELAVRRGTPLQQEEIRSKPRDIWINIRGGGSAQRTNELDDATTFFNTPEYLATHSTLKVIAWESTYGQREAITNNIVDEVRRERSLGITVGRILILGSSSGGKAAVLVTNALWARLQQPSYYLCVADGAFDRNDPLFSSPGDGVAKCRQKENYFQAWSNSRDPTEETHGAIQGFQVNQRQMVCEKEAEQAWNTLSPSDQKNRDKIKGVIGMAHLCATSIGMREGREKIRKILRGEISF